VRSTIIKRQRPLEHIPPPNGILVALVSRASRPSAYGR
jgi:hypothetical protein